MKIFSQLEKAQLENTTSDTGSLPKGMITYRTDLNLPKVSNGASMLALIDESSAQTLSGKTYASPVTTGAIQGAQIATPSNPSAGNNKVYFKSDGFLYTLDSSGNEAKVGSGSGGVKNLITNGSADDTASSIFVPYQDSSGTRPSDGTGGTTTGITTSVSSTTPLDGTKVFLLTKDASNRQGGGWAIPFDVPLAYRAKSMKISVQYIVNSGTFVAGSSTTESDVIWYLYDVTNSTLIEPSNIKMFSNSSTLSDVYEATFQTSATGSSYRLIAHIQSTSASAYELKVDNVTVSPQTYVYGTPKTNPASFTPTGTFTTNTTYTGKWFRDGHEMVLDVQLDFSGAPNSTTFSLNVPFGLSIDTSKFANTTAGIKVLHGSCAVIDTGVGTYALQARYDSATTINLRMLDENGTAIRYGTDLTQAAPFTLGNTDQIVITGLRIPIVGWDSSTQMSDTADGRVTTCYAYKNGNTTFNANAARQQVLIDTAIEDTHGMRTGNTVVIPTSGYYNLAASALWTGANMVSGGTYEIMITTTTVNGTILCVSDQRCAASGAFVTTSCRRDGVYLTAGTVLCLGLYSNQNHSVNTVTIDGTFHNWTFISVQKVQGLSAIAATETIIAAVEGDPASATAGNPIIAPSKSLDTHGAYNTSTGRFTCPSAGTYRVAGYIGGDVAGISILLYKNGSGLVAMGVTIPTYFTTPIYGVIKCNAGDILDIRPNGTLNADGNSKWSFERI